MRKRFNAGGKTMDIQPVKTDADYRRALKEIETLMTAAPESPEGSDWMPSLPSSKPTSASIIRWKSQILWESSNSRWKEKA